MNSEICSVYNHYLLSKKVEKYSLEELCDYVFSTLNCQYLNHLIPEIVHIFEIGRSRLSVKNMCWSVKRVEPLIIFMVLKMNGLFINLRYYIPIFGITKQQFSEGLKLAVKSYPKFQKRDKVFIVKEYLKAFVPLISTKQKDCKVIMNVWEYIYPFVKKN